IMTMTRYRTCIGSSFLAERSHAQPLAPSGRTLIGLAACSRTTARISGKPHPSRGLPPKKPGLRNGTMRAMPANVAQLPLAAVVDLGGRAHYLHSGWFLISVANLVVIVA